MERLTAREGRVVASLVEKQLTIPQHYPLTLNALVAACNQSTSRDPVSAYSEQEVLDAVESLRAKRMVRAVLPSHGRSVVRYRHVLDETLGLDAGQLAVLAVLELRGPQTVAELRARTERLAAIESVDHELGLLASREEPLAAQIARRPGQKVGRPQPPRKSGPGKSLLRLGRQRPLFFALPDRRQKSVDQRDGKLGKDQEKTAKERRGGDPLQKRGESGRNKSRRVPEQDQSERQDGHRPDVKGHRPPDPAEGPLGQPFLETARQSEVAGQKKEKAQKNGRQGGNFGRGTQDQEKKGPDLEGLERKGGPEEEGRESPGSSHDEKVPPHESGAPAPLRPRHQADEGNQEPEVEEAPPELFRPEASGTGFRVLDMRAVHDRDRPGMGGPLLRF